MYTTHVSHSLPIHHAYSNHMPNAHYHSQPLPNGHSHHSQHLPPQNARQTQPPPAPKDPVTVLGIPSVTVHNNQLLVGDSRSTSTRSYTPLKVVGDGSFGTVWLCDWHGTLPPNTPLSAMQCGAGAKREYAGKRLVAVKRMKKKWEGGWDECKKLKELESLRAIPYHPNIIPLYDFFLLPSTKELYFVFESMEGNLYQLIKTRKGKPLAGGLVSSIFRQVVSGLHHIHASGYFHRDMKPENLLVTTTGLYDYRTLSPVAPPDAPPEKDVVVIVKLADFGLARETRSRPPYTEYVSTRWYRAPEVLLRSTNYSNPVDMWALGTIMAELVNLRPLFPGQGEFDQVGRICDLLGDPVDDYGIDEWGKPVGGGQWPRGVELAKERGFAFQKIVPKDIRAMFDPSVPPKLVDCIADLLKYDPRRRLTSLECLEHPYLIETTPLNNPPPPPALSLQAVQPMPPKVDTRVMSASLHSISPRHLPPSHTHTSVNDKLDIRSGAPLANVHIPDASSSHRTSFFETHTFPRARESSESLSRISDTRYDVPSGVPPPGLRQQGTDGQSSGFSSAYSYAGDRYYAAGSGQPDWDAMDISPQAEGAPDHYVVASGQTEIQTSPMAREYPARPVEPEPIHDPTYTHEASQAHAPKLSKLAPFGFGKKSSKWGLSMFGHGDKGQGQPPLPPVQEVNVASAGSVPSLKRTQSSSTDSRSLSELSPIATEPPQPAIDAKSRKKEAERMQREAQQQQRQLAQKMHRDQARAVMEKQRRMIKNGGGDASTVDWHWLAAQSSTMSVPPPSYRPPKNKQVAATGSIRQTQSHGPSSPTVGAAGGSYNAGEGSHWRRSDEERVPKARRREFDDDHSMSSSDLQGGMSVISFATVDSDPGPGRSRHRTSTYAGSSMGRMTSMNSLRTDDFSLRGRSSASFSLEKQLNDFNLRTSVDTPSLSEGGASPPPPAVHMLSLSSPTWQPQHERSPSASVQDSGSLVSRRPEGLHLSLHPPSRHQQFFGGQPVGHPPSPGVAPKSAINPIFKVPPLQGFDRPGSLPPFSHLEAVADGEYPPLSPMSFTSPDDMDDDPS